MLKRRTRHSRRKRLRNFSARGAGIANPHIVSGADSLNPVNEDAGVSTNEAAQTGLQTIEILELCKDQLPAAAAVRTVRPRGGRGGQGATVPPAGTPAPSAN
jgi:hypothetical protein